MALPSNAENKTIQITVPDVKQALGTFCKKGGVWVLALQDTERRFLIDAEKVEEIVEGEPNRVHDMTKYFNTKGWKNKPAESLKCAEPDNDPILMSYTKNSISFKQEKGFLASNLGFVIIWE